MKPKPAFELLLDFILIENFLVTGTFFQPFINGINTFFNPSQFRNPLLNFRDNQQQQQQQRQPQPPPQQQQFNTNFQSQPQPNQPSQQFGASQQTFNFQDFRNNPTFQQDFSLTRFPQVSCGAGVTFHKYFLSLSWLQTYFNLFPEMVFCN